MSKQRTCSECGSTIPESSRDGYCPKCLIGLAMAPEEEITIAPFSEYESPNLTGRTFGDYELLEQVGQGGMGVVYKARQVDLDRVVAIKLMIKGLQATEAEIHRFHTEARAAATLQHPNVVAIHEVGEHAGLHYFSMDYVAGQNLSDVIRRTPLQPERAARYVRTIAETIQYAHERGILHLDLKPQNVLIDDKDQPRVTDFGLARQIQLDSGLTGGTLSGVVMGTPSYMPPEQAQGRRKQTGPASDVYSIGAILYDCLTARPPFRADTPIDTLRQVVETDPAAPRLLNRSVPRDLETICLKCLAKEPARRYPSAKELTDDLDRFLNNQPIKARPIGPLARTVRWCRRHPALAASVGAVGLLLLSVTAGALLFAVQLEGRLVSKTLQENQILAGRVAGQIRDQFGKWGRTVAQIAGREEIRKGLKAKDQKRLQALMRQITDEHSRARDQDGALQSWYVENPDGRLLGAFPLKDPAIIGRRYDSRDYFIGAMKHANSGERDLRSVHLSKVFKADNDQNYKFALAAAVYDGPGLDAARLGIVAATVTTNSRLGSLSLDDPRTKVVLTGRLESGEKGNRSSYLVLLHSGIQEAGKERIELSDEAEMLLTRIHRPQHDNELDALSSVQLAQQAREWESWTDPNYKDPKFPGRWLAAFAPVGGTECVIIVQTPYQEASDWVRLLRKDLSYDLVFSGGSALTVLAATAAAAALIALLKSRKSRESQ